MKVLS